MKATRATIRRIEVLELRVRIERLARRCVVLAASDPADVRVGGAVHGRLLFALMAAGPTTIAVHKQVRLVQFVYRRACDVLHGRVDSLEVPDAMIREWRLAIQRLETAIDDQDGDAAGPTSGGSSDA